MIRGEDGKTTTAHRVSWVLHVGAIPSGHGVFHRCDNPPCCNPGHLFSGPQADNMKDMRIKGRAVKVPTYGEQHWMCKLSTQAVATIREAYRPGLGGQLARRFGVSHSTICRIVRGEARPRG
jgi:hypothetical protein